jgi:hypothetical protein
MSNGKLSVLITTVLYHTDHRSLHGVLHTFPRYLQRRGFEPGTQFALLCTEKSRNMSCGELGKLVTTISVDCSRSAMYNHMWLTWPEDPTVESR